MINTVPFLIKKLKWSGFSEEIQITIYKSLVLSHIDYSSIVLDSATNATKNEIASLQKRILKIIGISAETALAKYGIEDIENHIEKTCIKRTLKILNDPHHRLAIELTNNNQRTTRNNFKYNIPIARTEKLNNNAVMKTLRYVRDGTTNKYSDKQHNEQLKPADTAEKAMTTCDRCRKTFTSAGINRHKKVCANKQ